jgi:hypothetical protein
LTRGVILKRRILDISASSLSLSDEIPNSINTFDISAQLGLKELVSDLVGSRIWWSDDGVSVFGYLINLK